MFRITGTEELLNWSLKFFTKAENDPAREQDRPLHSRIGLVSHTRALYQDNALVFSVVDLILLQALSVLQQSQPCQIRNLAWLL